MNNLYLHMMTSILDGCLTHNLGFFGHLQANSIQLTKDVGIYDITWGLAVPDFGCMILPNDKRCIAASRMIGPLIRTCDQLSELLSSHQNHLSDTHAQLETLSLFCRAYLREAVLHLSSGYVIVTWT